MFCPHCGAQIVGTGAFCSSCGSPISQQIPQASQQPRRQMQQQMPQQQMPQQQMPQQQMPQQQMPQQLQPQQQARQFGAASGTGITPEAANVMRMVEGALSIVTVLCILFVPYVRVTFVASGNFTPLGLLMNFESGTDPWFMGLFLMPPTVIGIVAMAANAVFCFSPKSSGKFKGLPINPLAWSVVVYVVMVIAVSLFVGSLTYRGLLSLNGMLAITVLCGVACGVLDLLRSNSFTR